MIDYLGFVLIKKWFLREKKPYVNDKALVPKSQKLWRAVIVVVFWTKIVTRCQNVELVAKFSEYDYYFIAVFTIFLYNVCETSKKPPNTYNATLNTNPKSNNHPTICSQRYYLTQCQTRLRFLMSTFDCPAYLWAAPCYSHIPYCRERYSPAIVKHWTCAPCCTGRWWQKLIAYQKPGLITS